MTDRGRASSPTLISLENGKALRRRARARSPTPPSSSAGTPRRRCATDGLVTTAPSGANRILVRAASRSASACWSRRGTSRRRWRPARSGPALAAGCTVVLKPASDTPLTALADGADPRRRRRARRGWSTSLPARRSGAVVSAMLHDDRVRKLSFTGSTEVGRVLLKEAADQVVNSLDGARRQRAVPRLRRRRPRRRVDGRDDRQDAQRRRGLHGGQPVLRRGVGRRGVRRRGWPSGWAR